MATHVFVADAGHGGSDVGTTAGGLVEKTLNLATVLRFKERMEATYIDVEVILTRSSDVFVGLSERPAIANRLDGDPIFLSFHHNNSGGSTAPRGFEQYVYGAKSWVTSTGAHAPRSYELAKAMEPALKAMCEKLGLPYRGVKDGNFAVLRECNRRAVLFESFYASNQQDVAIAKRADFVDTLVEGYVQALGDALGLKRKETKQPLFTDVDVDHPFYDELAAMKNAGFVNGRSDGSLGLSDEATRVLVISYRMFLAKNG